MRFVLYCGVYNIPKIFEPAQLGAWFNMACIYIRICLFAFQSRVAHEKSGSLHCWDMLGLECNFEDRYCISLISSQAKQHFAETRSNISKLSG